MIRRPQLPTRFPYTTLFRSIDILQDFAQRREALGISHRHQQRVWMRQAERLRRRMIGHLFIELFEVLMFLALAQTMRKLLADRSEEHTSELQSLRHLVCRLL